jgi:hypothetical protein
MNPIEKIRNKWCWHEIMELEMVDLKNGDVNKWLEEIFASQEHAHIYYDCAHSQLLLKHLNQVKNQTDEIIDQLKKRKFESNQFLDQINILMDMDRNQQYEYQKLQNLFKQNGNIMTEACKLVHYLDEFTWKSNNMIKTVLDYYNVVKINKYMLKCKLSTDTETWKEKRKALICPPRPGRTVAISNKSPSDEILKVTFSVGD